MNNAKNFDNNSNNQFELRLLFWFNKIISNLYLTKLLNTLTKPFFLWMLKKNL